MLELYDQLAAKPRRRPQLLCLRSESSKAGRVWVRRSRLTRLDDARAWPIFRSIDRVRKVVPTGWIPCSESMSAAPPIDSMCNKRSRSAVGFKSGSIYKTMSDFYQPHSALDLLRRFEGNVEARRRYLRERFERMQEVDAQLEAMTALADPDVIMQTLDSERRPPGGLPVAIKDIFDTCNGRNACFCLRPRTRGRSDRGRQS